MHLYIPRLGLQQGSRSRGRSPRVLGTNDGTSQGAKWQMPIVSAPSLSLPLIQTAFYIVDYRRTHLTRIYLRPFECPRLQHCCPRIFGVKIFSPGRPIAGPCPADLSRRSGRDGRKIKLFTHSISGTSCSISNVHSSHWLPSRGLHGACLRWLIVRRRAGARLPGESSPWKRLQVVPSLTNARRVSAIHHSRLRFPEMWIP